MVKKSVKTIWLLVVVTFLSSCESRNSEISRQLVGIEKQFLSLVPTLQDHSVLISDSQGSRTGMFLAGGLVITSSKDHDVKGGLISIDFTHAQQVQGAVVGKSEKISLIRLVSDVKGLPGIDFSPIIDSQGLGLFVAFSDPNAPRPSVRIIRDIKKSADEFNYDELDDGGAIINMDGELCGVYNHSKKQTVYARQFRRDWNRIFGVDHF